MNNGYSGRQLYRLFKQQGFVEVSVEMCSGPFTDYAFARQIFVMDSGEREALAAGVVTNQDIDRLHTGWEQANAEGAFFASASMILVSGRKL